eukprot:scaffold15909_cov106-Skeletonema_dohrnii-CCMP3373.AAC.3
MDGDSYSRTYYIYFCLFVPVDENAWASQNCCLFPENKSLPMDKSLPAVDAFLFNDQLLPPPQFEYSLEAACNSSYCITGWRDKSNADS